MLTPFSRLLGGQASRFSLRSLMGLAAVAAAAVVLLPGSNTALGEASGAQRGLPGPPLERIVITVDTIIDAADVSPGDGICDALSLPGTQCSLRAAIQEANADSRPYDIGFDILGPGPHVIDIATDLPAVVGAGTAIDGSGESACGERWCVRLVFATELLSAGLSVGGPSVVVRGIALEGQTGAPFVQGGVVLGAGADQALLEGLLVTGFVSTGILQAAGAGGSNIIIHDNLVEANGEGIRLLEGRGNFLQSNAVVANEVGGVSLVDQKDMSVADNILAENGSFQLNVSGGLTDNVLVARNFVLTASDGIVVDAVGTGASIGVGVSEGAANIFRGPLSQSGGPDPGDDWYLQNSSDAAVDARWNDWNAYNRFDIEEVICAFNASHGCGTGTVEFQPFVSSALPTPVPTGTGVPEPAGTPTPTATPSGPEVVFLAEGCNLRAFQPFYPSGTPLRTIAGDVKDPAVRLWFQVAGTNRFDLFDPSSPERSTMQALGPGDEAGFVCVNFNTLWERPRA